ncbi:MAG: Type IV fimbrial assembly protein PilC [Erysipelotrichaceae bacterium]|nr:MAG: Type IV fimbrial assembly protein [Erysipelotrichaceae bacterium]TXT16340.1 MAG: Type IV fimbrial assembly protein PilC [Erysipelotrichaceae bacterium]
MKFYKVIAVTETGARKTEVIASENVEEIYESLKERSLFLVDYKQVAKSGKNKMKTRELIIFTRQLSAMIDAGVAILKGINIIENSTKDAKVKKLYQNLTQEIQKGNSLSVAMRKQSGAFPDILINMVVAGEMGGTLEKSLLLMSMHFEKEQKLKNKIKGAMTYPIILGVIAVSVVILLMTFVLPTLTQMFDPGTLPPLTSFVMGISRFLTTYWFIYIPAVFLLITGFIALLRVPSFRLKFDHFILRMPIIGPLNQTIYSARCARSFASLYLSGIQTIPMIQSTAQILGNSYIESLFDEVVMRVSHGEIISKALEDMGVFDPMLSSMVNVGEETGALGDILVRTADYFDEEADTALSKMVALVEPIMLVLMGVIIGVIVVSVIQPMFAMYDQIGN